MASSSPERFSLVAGGPFHAVLGRLGLLSPEHVASKRAAIVLAGIAWLPPTAFVIVQALISGDPSAHGYLADLTVPARFLIGIGMLVATEQYADRRFLMLTRQFGDARLLPESARPAFLSILTHADRRSSSRIAESILFVFAFVWPGFVASHSIELAGTSWEGAMVGGKVVLSWAGAYARYVSTPLFVFIVTRWLWRFGVWTALLVRIARLPLQLAPMHPDRSAGLGFLAIYPSIFSGLVFALSCGVASSMLKELGLAKHDANTVWLAIGVWLVMAFVTFIGPLLVFVAPIYGARERAQLEYGRLAHHHHLAFHQKWVSDARDGDELMGSTDVSSAADLNASVQAIRDIRVVPIDLAAFIQLLVAAGVPMLAVVLSQIPLAELVRWIAGTIF